jgi:hypothetical protein
MLSVNITDPVGGTIFTGPADIILTAVAEATNPLSYVQFYFGTNLIGQVSPTISGYGPVISGTVALTNSNALVTGTSTTFTTDFIVGNYIVFGSQPAVTYQILSITDDLHLHLSTPFTGITIGNDTARTVTIYGYFNLAWNNVALGSYSLTAIVGDITSATATSAPVMISVVGQINTTPNQPITGSSIGFGHNPFGDHEFGVGDWAEEVLWKNMPEFYRVADANGPPNSIIQQPLRQFVNALKPFYQELRDKWGDFISLWDADQVPLSNLPQLAYNVGITVDPTKSEGLQRSSVLNASQLWINKGTAKGYQITAAFEGLLVQITPLWAQSCAAADQILGTIGAAAASFDLSTTIIVPHPVAPGSLHIEVTTSQGLAQSIRDDTNGNLVGFGTQPNGPLTKIFVTQAFTLEMSSITGGAINIGDTLTQGLTTGIVLGTLGFTIKVHVTAGAFVDGPVTDSTSSANAVIATVAVDSFTIDEVIAGRSSGATAIVEDNQTTFLLIDTITSFAGFTVGEVLIGETSGSYAIAGISTPLLPGPLQTAITFSVGVGSYLVGELVTGVTSGATGLVRTGGAGTILVDTITQPGFVIGETLIGSVSFVSKTIGTLNLGTINYLTGALTGHTWALKALSTVNSVVDLITTEPDQFLPSFDSVPADLVPLDDVQTTRYALWPIYENPVRIESGILTTAQCRSYSLRLYFFKPNNTEIEDFIDVATRITMALESFRPIHVRFDKISFDGTHASSQLWRTGKIIADSFATATWTTNVTGNQQSSSQLWTISNMIATPSI